MQTQIAGVKRPRPSPEDELEQDKAAHAADDDVGAATTSHDGNTNEVPALEGVTSSQVAFKATATAAAAGAGVQEQKQHMMSSTGSPGPKRTHWQRQQQLQHSPQLQQQQLQQQQLQQQLLLQQHSQQLQQQQLQMLQSSHSRLKLATAAHAGEMICRSISMHHTPAVLLVSYNACCCRCDA
jgi:hypothetical protein